MTKKATKKILVTLAFPLGVAAFLLAVWAVAAAVMDEPLILPTVGQTLKTFFSLLGQGSFYRALGGTLLRAAISFAISFAVAAGLTALTYFTRSPLPERVARPFLSVMRALPTMAAVLLLIVWTNSRVAPVVVTVLVALPNMYSQLKTAFTPDAKILEMSRAFGVDAKTEFKGFVLPSAMGGVIETAASNASLILKLLVAAEVLAHTRGSLGLEMWSSQYYFETARLMALTLAVVLLGAALEAGIGAFKRCLKGGERQ